MEEITGRLQALADTTRLRLLTMLADDDATVSDLAARLGLPQPRVSAHLAVLREAGLVSVNASGRQRAYHVDAERFQAAMSALRELGGEAAPSAPQRSRQAMLLVQRDAAIRQGRTCYDHLAGVAGVRLLEELLQRGWLAVDRDDGKRTHYTLTESGTQALMVRGVDLEEAAGKRRLYAYGCLDWTERRPHLGGALGAALLDALTEAGVVERAQETRTAVVRVPVEQWLDTEIAGWRFGVA